MYSDYQQESEKMKPLPGFEKVHFVGIGGAGMSSLAEVMSSNGFIVSGSEIQESNTSRYLESLGIPLDYSQGAENHLKNSDVVVYSSAVSPENPERLVAVEQGIPTVKRSEILGEFTKKKWCMAVAGTHGKTTTTLMLANIWSKSSRFPTVIGGGVLQNSVSSAQAAEGPYMIVEADEFDRSFLNMYPTVAVVTNIDSDHLDCYRDLNEIKDTFVEFLDRIPFYGFAVLNGDDEGIKDIHSRVKARKYRYGFSKDCDFRAIRCKNSPQGCEFDVEYEGKVLFQVKMPVFGLHNISNALAAIAVSYLLEQRPETIQKGLKNFSGASRRLQNKGEYQGVTLLDDYAHHPTEVATTLDSVQYMGGQRVIVVFQPHLYSRTQSHYKEFAQSLMSADEIYLLPLYPARETPILGVSSHLIADELQALGHANTHCMSNNIEEFIVKRLQKGDILITMGAGDVWATSDKLIEILKNQP